MERKMRLRNGRIIKILLFVIFNLSSIIAPKADAAFMDTGFSARGGGLGGAYASLSGASDFIFYNPAGLSGITNPELSLYYHKPFAGLSNVQMNTGAFSFAMPVYTKGVFGLGYTQFSAGDSEAKLYQETSFSAALAYAFSPKISAGATVKQLGHEYFPDERTMSIPDDTWNYSWNSSALTADAGINAVVSRTLRAGLSWQNFIRANIGIYDRDVVPSILRLAGNFTEGRVTLALEYDARNQHWGRETTTGVGGEWRISDVFAMRAGHSNDELSFGFGLNMKIFGGDGLAFNYAYCIPYGIRGVVSHRIEVRLTRRVHPAAAVETAPSEKSKEDSGGYWKEKEKTIEIK